MWLVFNKTTAWTWTTICHRECYWSIQSILVPNLPETEGPLLLTLEGVTAHPLLPNIHTENGGMGFGNQLHEAGILQADLSLCRVQVLLITIITGVWINILSPFSNFSWPLGWDAASIGQKKRPGGQWGWMASVDWHMPELSCRGVTATAELCNAGKLV